MIFHNLINFIFKILVLFLRVIIFSISKIIIFRFIVSQNSRIGGIARLIEIFKIEKKNARNSAKVIYLCFREIPNCNIFFSNLVEKKLKKLHQNIYFFNSNKFSEYLFSSFNNKFSFGKINCSTYLDVIPSPYSVEKHESHKYDEAYKYTNFLFDYDFVKKPLYNLNTYEVGAENKFLHNIISEKKKWICIHNRDSKFLKNLSTHKNFRNIDFNYHNYRDSDVNKLISATKLLVDKNFYVFRMGKIQSKKMDFKHKNFIDYAFTDEKSDFNDIFLLSNCEAYMGSDAGLGDIPLLSGKPRFLINYSLTTLHPFHNGGCEMSRKNHYSFIFKHLYDEKLQKKLTLKQIINRKLLGVANGNEFKKAGVLPIENSEEEILDLTLEMTNYLETKNINAQEDFENQKRFWDIYYANTSYKRYEDIPARICSKFLSKNLYILE